MTSLVASDIDGTLLRSDKTISARTRAAVTDLAAAGVGFVLVTGRAPRWLPRVVEQLDADALSGGVAICANGGLVVDLDSWEVVHVEAFAPGPARAVLAAIRSLDAPVSLGVEWPDGFAHDRDYPRGIRRSEHVDGVVEVTDDEEFLAHPVAKVLVRPHDDSPAGLAEALVDAVDGAATVTWSSTRLLEVSAAGVTKAAALRRLTGGDGIEAAGVVAFGDMPNDLAMLAWAGHGVAVANADPRVLDAADEVTASNDDDGVAVVLERIAADRT